MAGDFQQKELSGSLFKNERKEQPNHPDYRGSAKIEGEEYWVSGWIKEGAKGKWMSLAFTAKDGGFSRPDKPKPPPADFDDIPF
jgi:hypothetical protein